MIVFTRSFCVVCTNGHTVVKRAFFDYPINDVNQVIADVVADAAQQFCHNNFNVFIRNLHTN